MGFNLVACSSFISLQVIVVLRIILRAPTFWNYPNRLNEIDTSLFHSDEFLFLTPYGSSVFLLHP